MSRARAPATTMSMGDSAGEILGEDWESRDVVRGVGVEKTGVKLGVSCLYTYYQRQPTSTYRVNDAGSPLGLSLVGFKDGELPSYDSGPLGVGFNERLVGWDTGPLAQLLDLVQDERCVVFA